MLKAGAGVQAVPVFRTCSKKPTDFLVDSLGGCLDGCAPPDLAVLVGVSTDPRSTSATGLGHLTCKEHPWGHRGTNGGCRAEVLQGGLCWSTA